MEKVKWGILSTANIGVKQVIPAMQKGEFCSIEAIASRNEERARSVASDLGIPKAYASYEALLADDDIDAIYNPLPNHLHVEWTLKALEAGKHVLCEKPIGLNAEEATSLLEKIKRYPDLKVMEAFMYRFNPQWEGVKSWMKSGEIGELKTIHSEFTYYNDDPKNIRNKPGIGGGGLLDIGCYCISATRYLFEEEPVKVFGEIEYDPEMGIDRLASGIMKFKKGTATFTCSTQASPEQHLKIFGTKGMITVSIPFNPVQNETTISLIKEGELIQEHSYQVNQYTLQGNAFSKAILNNEPVPTPLKDALNNMKVIDAVFASDKKNTWAEIK